MTFTNCFTFQLNILQNHALVIKIFFVGVHIELQKKLLDPDQRDSTPDDNFLDLFAEVVGPKWPSLASLLSLTNEEIEEVKTEGKGQSQQVQALSMLKKWTSKEGASSTYDQLSQKLRKISLFQYV